VAEAFAICILLQNALSVCNGEHGYAARQFAFPIGSVSSI
jgi:hypothetical protein